MKFIIDLVCMTSMISMAVSTAAGFNRPNSSKTGSFSTSGPLDFQWVINNITDQPILVGGLDLKMQGSEKAWGMIGFGDTSLSLTSNLKALIVEGNSQVCSVLFAERSGLVTATDPWSTNAHCFYIPDRDTYYLSFQLGDGIHIPDGPSYISLGYGFNESFSSIPQNLDYVLVEFFSGTSTSVDQSNLSKPDPWLVAHGIVFIIVFSIMMPVASYIILYDRERFYALHNALGVVILILLVVGWASLTGANKHKEAGVIFLPMNDSAVGRSHSVTGIIARFVAVAVCLIGVILGVVRMPKKVRSFVRWSHGIVGVLLSFYGPIVVWNGWVRIGVTYTTLLDTSPIVWLSVAIGLLLAYTIGKYMSYRKEAELSKKMMDYKETTTESLGGDVEKSAPYVSLPEFLDIVKDKVYFLFNGTEVVVLDTEFVHPGGNEVMLQFFGKDISGVFGGAEVFQDGDRNRSWAHSTAALARLKEMRVCVIDLLGDGNSTIAGGGAGGRGMTNFSIDDGKTVGIVVGKETVNRNSVYPVLKMEIKVIDILAFSVLVVGSKVRLSLSYGEDAVERTYTVAEIVPADRTIVFYVKIYPSGILSSRLATDVSLNDSVFLSSLAAPLALPNPGTPLLLICGGTGIVPMLSYLGSSEAPATVGDQKRVLKWWMHSPHDLFVPLALRELSEGVEVEIFFTGLSESDRSFVEEDSVVKDLLREMSGLVQIAFGRIASETLPTNIGTSSLEWSVVMSGPPGFVTAANAVLKGAGFPNVLSLD